VIFHSRQFEIGGAQIHFGRHDGQPLEGGIFDFVEQAAFTQQNPIRAGALGFFQAEAAGGVGLRSRSNKSTRWPSAARHAARLTAVVVLPTPPFWLATAMTLVGTRPI